MKIIDKVYKIINDEIEEVKNMTPDKDENEISFKVRQNHYLAELKAIKGRIFIELN
jgi:hypothetical protein